MSDRADWIDNLLIIDSGPVPITPDYAGPHVRYADGVFDGRLNRYIAVREGTYIFTYNHNMFCLNNSGKDIFSTVLFAVTVYSCSFLSTNRSSRGWCKAN